MKEQVRGMQFSILAHALVMAALWMLSLSPTPVSRLIEIDFGMVKEEAPKATAQIKPDQKERTRPVARPRIIEQQVTPSVSEDAAPVAAPKLPAAVEPQAAASAAPSNRRSVENIPFGSVLGPNFLHREMPVYPHMARRMNKEGKVILRLTIDEHGRLLNTEVVETAGFGFTEAAVDAVKKSTYRPAKRDGVAVLSRALLPVRFELRNVN